jgi:hypothetical protein
VIVTTGILQVMLPGSGEYHCRPGSRRTCILRAKEKPLSSAAFSKIRGVVRVVPFKPSVASNLTASS